MFSAGRIKYILFDNMIYWYIIKAGMKDTFIRRFIKNRAFLIMLIPAVVYTLVFSYIPMGGIILAFKRYTYAGGIFGSPWNGLRNFEFFFKSGRAFLVTRNTVL